MPRDKSHARIVPGEVLRRSPTSFSIPQRLAALAASDHDVSHVVYNAVDVFRDSGDRIHVAVECHAVHKRAATCCKKLVEECGSIHSAAHSRRRKDHGVGGNRLDDRGSVLRHRHQRGDAAAPVFMLVRFIPHFPVFDPAGSVSGHRPDKIIPVLHIRRWITGPWVVIALSARIRRRPSRRGAKGVNHINAMLLGGIQPSVERGPVEVTLGGVEIVPGSVRVPQSDAAERN